MELAEGSPEVYLEMARTVETESGYDAARKILEDSLKKAPASAEIYEALTDLEWRNGHTDQAVKILEDGLKSATKKDNLHLKLATVLAVRGDTSKLAPADRRTEENRLSRSRCGFTIIQCTLLCKCF